jgi:gliding motility-associated-like protein/uncharacterized repeat protein (TIGR01451 family)
MAIPANSDLIVRKIAIVMKKNILCKILLRVLKTHITLGLRFANNLEIKLVLDKKLLYAALLVPSLSICYGQLDKGKGFESRYNNESIRGNLVLIGNTMLGVTRTGAVVGTGDGDIPTNLATLTTQANLSSVYTNQADGSPWQPDALLDGKEPKDAFANNQKSMEYIDIDTDNSTFASSSATLNIESPCKKIVYAGLYWQAVYINDRSKKFNSQPGNTNNYSGTDRIAGWNNVKFKLPGTSDYIDITADKQFDNPGEEDDIIFDGLNYGDISKSFRNAPYLCYKNVTNILKGLNDPNGEYFVANIRATKGRRNLGSTSGWTLVVVYEDITLPSKKIITFDGFIGIEDINGNGKFPTELNFKVDGFITPAGPEPVKATIGIVSQEGEIPYTNDALKIKIIDGKGKFVFQPIYNTLNDSLNVFNSSITVPAAPLFADYPVVPGAEYITSRNPNRLNTFGFDMDLININKGYLRNGQTSLDLKLTTTGDAYAVSLVTLAIDIVQPNVVLSQTVTNENNVVVGYNEVVNLGEYLTYKIAFSNNGDDNAKDVRIKDILPKNVIFNYPTDLINLPNGVTVDPVVKYNNKGEQISGYNPETRTIIFEISDDVVNIGDTSSVIEFKVKIVSCIDLGSDPNFELSCDLTISNEVSTTFSGVINQTPFTGDSSGLINNCTTENAKTNNILSKLQFCDKSSDGVFCPPTAVLSATDGFESYDWSMSPTGLPVFQSRQTITIGAVGTYYVVCTPFTNPLPDQACAPLKEIITVIPFVMSKLDPFKNTFAEKVICATSIKKLTNFYLCEDRPTIDIFLEIPDGVLSITWEKSNCPLIQGAVCPDESTTCTWNDLNNSDNKNYTIDDEGQYRVTLNYGPNCSDPYYFNVYGMVTPKATLEHIFCNTPGKIVVGMPAMGSGYEYSLDKINYQASTTLPVTTAGTYTVYIRPTAGNVAKCSYEIPDIEIEYKDLKITHKVINSTLKCFDDDSGSIVVTANNVRPNYKFSIYDGNILLKTSGMIASNTYTFGNLRSGDYNVLVTTEDGCQANYPFTISSPEDLSANAKVTRVLTCKPAEVTVTPIGGTAPYTFTVYGNNADGDQYERSYSGSGPITIVIPIHKTAMNYKFQVIDANNCKEVYAGLYSYKPLEDLVLQIISSKDIKCKEDLTGEITAAAKGSLGNYVYTLLDDAGLGLPFTPVQPTPGNFIKLPAGLYQVSVISGDCGPVIVPTEIKEPSLTLTHHIKFDNVTCAGLANVTIVVEATGGTGKIQYAISSIPNKFFDTGVFSGIKAGIYSIAIKDENNCGINDVVTIIDPQPIQAFVVQGSIKQEICIGEKTGAFSIDITGGVSPYSTSLDNPNGDYTLGKVDFDKLSGGKHTVYILDKNNCPFELAVLLNIPTITLKPTVKVSYNCENNEPANKVTVKIDASNKNPSLVKYLLDGKEPRQDSNVFNNVSSGDHFVKAVHTSGCEEASPMFTVDKLNPPLTISLDLGGLNEIVITVKGGSGFYNSITINNEIIKFTNKYIYYRSGDYTVFVTDSNGCTATVTKYFEFIDIIIPNIFTPNGSGINDGWKPLRQDNYPEIIIRIYDRYGREVGVLNSEESWDGKYKGVDLPTGDYWYALKLRNTKDDREFMGNVTLYR